MKKQYVIIVAAAAVLAFLSAFIFNVCKKVDFDPVTKSYIKDTYIIDSTNCTLYLKIHSLNPKLSHPDYGICYSSSNAEPSINNNIINFGAITDTLTKTVIVKNLKHSTKYYFRSFVMDEENAKYGDVISLSTPKGIAKLTTNEVSNITATSAICGGNITSDDGFTITARGVCWSKSQNPTTSNTHTTNGSGTGSFTSSITGLTTGTTYYVRAYATNSMGTQYGNQISFTPYSTFKDSRDGNVYKTVKIGNQVWMAENLKYLPSVVGPGTGSTTTSYYYVYGYDGTSVSSAKATSNYKTYGVLYNWPAAKKSCPNGWHLPSDSEWTQMENYLANNAYNYDGSTGGGRDKIAKALASKSGWNSSSPTGAVGNTDYSSYRNKSGFTALPGGARYNYGNFYGLGDNGNWWSATENDSNYAWRRYLYYDNSNVNRGSYYMAFGYSVRCVRD